jgi:hypothetical protein
MAASQAVEQLAERTKALPTAEKFELVAGLIRGGRYDLAETVAELAVQDLQVRRLFGPDGHLKPHAKGGAR